MTDDAEEKARSAAAADAGERCVCEGGGERIGCSEVCAGLVADDDLIDASDVEVGANLERAGVIDDDDDEAADGCGEGDQPARSRWLTRRRRRNRMPQAVADELVSSLSR